MQDNVYLIYVAGGAYEDYRERIIGCYTRLLDAVNFAQNYVAANPEVDVFSDDDTIFMRTYPLNYPRNTVPLPPDADPDDNIEVGYQTVLYDTNDETNRWEARR